MAVFVSGPEYNMNSILYRIISVWAKHTFESLYLCVLQQVNDQNSPQCML